MKQNILCQNIHNNPAQQAIYNSQRNPFKSLNPFGQISIFIHLFYWSPIGIMSSQQISLRLLC